LIDVGLKPGDISPILRGFVHAFKARIYDQSAAAGPAESR